MRSRSSTRGAGCSIDRAGVTFPAAKESVSAMSSVGRKTVKTEKPDIDPGSKWYLDPGGPRFITQQDSWEVDGSTYVTLMDADRKELARVIRYDWTKTLAVEQYRAR